MAEITRLWGEKRPQRKTHRKWKEKDGGRIEIRGEECDM